MICKVPHLQKHCRKIPDGFSFNPDSGILPIAKTGRYIDILICNIDASGKCSLSIHNQDLPVIPVIHDN